jgi:CHAT domain-containing protein
VKAYAPRREPSFVHGQLHRRIEAFFAAEGALYRVSIDATAVAIDKVDELPRLLAMIERAAYDADAPEGATLRQLLLPDARLPPQDATLVIVPDAPLVQIRFAALRGPGGYLVERNPVVIAPTLAIATAAPPPTPPGPAVVLGDPDGSLPAARTEATAVAALLDVEARLGPAATRAAVESARRARVLHVASHGKADDDDTNLLLADGPLGSADVLERGIAPDLAVIASCTSAAWTAVGPWASVAGAFLASGSAMVIGALGSVPDGAARVLLTDFHHAAREHDPALALALAQRAAIRAGVPAQTWSTFVALGRPSASR